jgi:hypothetical protein
MILKVNVGMGATDPERKLNKFITGISAFSNVIKEAVPGLDYQEVGKEIFGHMGYADGSRFFNNQDPQVALLTQQLKQATALAQQLQQQVKDKKEVHMMGLQKNRETIEGSIKKTVIHEQNENKRALATHIAAIDASSKEGKEEPIPAERQEAMKLREMNMKHERERENNHLKFAGQLHKTEREHQAKLTLGAGLRNSEERAA